MDLNIIFNLFKSLFLWSLFSIIRLIKSRKMRWACHVARMGERRVYTGFWWGNLRERDSGVDGRIEVILRYIFGNWDEKAWTGVIWLRIGTGGGDL